MDLLKPVFTPIDSVKGLFRRIINYYKNTAFSFMYGAKYAAKRVFVLSLLVTAVLWLSVLLYASFYHIYVPSASLVRPAHFKFRACPAGAGLCSFPAANVTLSTESQAEMLGRGQQYRVVLKLEVPDSVPNRDIGMFMVISRLYDKYGAISQESSRAVTLRYQSDLLKLIQTVALSPLYITGFLEEIQIINIELFTDFWDDFYHPAVGILLEIHSRQLSFYCAQIQFHACYSGLRYYLFYYPLTSALCGIIFNILWVSLLFVLTWFRLGLDLLEGTPLNGKDIADFGQDGSGDSASQGYIQSFSVTPSSAPSPETVGRQTEKETNTQMARRSEGGTGVGRPPLSGSSQNVLSRPVPSSKSS